MKGFKKGGGGASPLNFTVVSGSSAPSNPKENTIWVNMTREVADYYFSATEPENPANGTVWIEIGTASSAAFNALKKNTLMVYPVAVHRYASGTTEDGEAYGGWDEKEAQFYQGGVWVSLDTVTFLYNSGDDCADLTGGWASYAYPSTAPTLTMDDTAMTIVFRAYTAGAVASQNVYYNGSVWTEKAIDLTDADSLFVLVTGATNVSDGYFQLRIAANKSASYTAVKSLNISATGLHSLDVSDLTGEYYVLFANSNSKSLMTVVINQVYYE